MPIPTQPGAYFDGGGDVWIHTTKGEWIDCDGARPPTMTDDARKFLESNGPYTPIPRSLSTTREYRVRNDKDNYSSTPYALLEEAKLNLEQDGDYIEERTAISVPWNRVEPIEEASADD